MFAGICLIYELCVIVSKLLKRNQKISFLSMINSRVWIKSIHANVLFLENRDEGDWAVVDFLILVCHYLQHQPHRMATVSFLLKQSIHIYWPIIQSMCSDRRINQWNMQYLRRNLSLFAWINTSMQKHHKRNNYVRSLYSVWHHRTELNEYCIVMQYS